MDFVWIQLGNVADFLRPKGLTHSSNRPVPASIHEDLLNTLLPGTNKLRNYYEWLDCEALVEGHGGKSYGLPVPDALEPPREPTLAT